MTRPVEHPLNEPVANKFWEQIGYTVTEGEAPPHPTHCQSCGRELVRYIEQDGYTPEGRPSLILTYRCPKTLGWWRRALLLHMLHDEYELSHFIDWYWDRRHYQ